MNLRSPSTCPVGARGPGRGRPAGPGRGRAHRRAAPPARSGTGGSATGRGQSGRGGSGAGVGPTASPSGRARLRPARTGTGWRSWSWRAGPVVDTGMPPRGSRRRDRRGGWRRGCSCASDSSRTAWSPAPGGPPFRPGQRSSGRAFGPPASRSGARARRSARGRRARQSGAGAAAGSGSGQLRCRLATITAAAAHTASSMLYEGHLELRAAGGCTTPVRAGLDRARDGNGPAKPAACGRGGRAPSAGSPAPFQPAREEAQPPPAGRAGPAEPWARRRSPALRIARPPYTPGRRRPACRSARKRAAVLADGGNRGGLGGRRRRKPFGRTIGFGSDSIPD